MDGVHRNPRNDVRWHWDAVQEVYPQHGVESSRHKSGSCTGEVLPLWLQHLLIGTTARSEKAQRFLRSEWQPAGVPVTTSPLWTPQLPWPFCHSCPPCVCTWPSGSIFLVSSKFPNTFSSFLAMAVGFELLLHTLESDIPHLPSLEVQVMSWWLESGWQGWESLGGGGESGVESEAPTPAVMWIWKGMKLKRNPGQHLGKL